MPITTDQKESIIASGATAFTVAAGNNLIVDKGITISANDPYAAIGLAGSNHLTLNGVASGGYAIYDTAGGSTIDIASTGTAAADYMAIFLNAGTTLNNYGIVTSNVYGIDTMGSVAVNNFGTIQSNEPNGVYAIAFNATGTHTVVNSGLIASLYGTNSHSIVGQGGVELITNTGTIHGDILLQGGNDEIDTHLGTMEGNVDLGAGNDTAYGSAAADSIAGGDENDVIRGNGGADNLDGGVGIADVLDYKEKTAEVNVSLNGGTTSTVLVGGVAEDTVVNFEWVYGGTLNDRLIGDSASNRLYGFAGKDFLNGLSGNDILDGGVGNDTMTGGAHNDSFRFDTALGSTNIDEITDFSHLHDTVQLDDAIFTALGASVTSDEFRAATASNIATNGLQHIIYDKSTGNLWYDDDGNGAHASVLFATLTSKPQDVDFTDFAIV